VSTTPDGRPFDIGLVVGPSPLAAPVERSQRIRLSNQRFEEKGDDDGKRDGDGHARKHRFTVGTGGS
jgi:hypothetical protein